jgi:hypothetical protein
MPRPDPYASQGWTDHDHERLAAQPTSITLTVTWGDRGDRAVTIDAAEYYGRHGGSPMAAEGLVAIIERLVRTGCPQ